MVNGYPKPNSLEVVRCIPIFSKLLSGHQKQALGDILVRNVENWGESIHGPGEANTLITFVEGLESLAASLTPDLRIRAANKLLDLLLKSDGLGTGKDSVITCLAALATSANADLRITVWEALVREFDRNNDASGAFTYIGKSLSILVPQLTSDEIGTCWTSLVDVLDAGAVTDIEKEILTVIAEMLPRLNTEQIKRSFACAVEVAKGSVKTGMSDEFNNAIAIRLPSVALQLSSDDLNECMDELEKCLANKLGPEGLRFINATITGIAANADSERLWKLADHLIDLFAQTEYSTYNSREEALSQIESLNCIKAIRTRLKPDQIERVWDLMMEKYSQFDKDAVFPAFNELSQSITTDQAFRSWDKLMSKLVQSDDGLETQRIASVMLTLVGRMPREMQLDATVKVIQSLNASEGGYAIEEIAKLLPLIDSDSRARYSTEAFVMLMDLLATEGQDYFVGDNFVDELGDASESDLTFAAMNITKAETIAKALGHPACHSQISGILLRRFEELILHQGSNELLHAPKPLELHEYTDTDASPESARRFKKLQDAAEWIEKNWPDFDLEATPQVTYRPTRN